MELLLPVANKNPNHHGNKSRRYLATGITPQAQDILKQLPLPLHIIAFAGLGRSGKSRTATEIRAKLTGNHNHKVGNSDYILYAIQDHEYHIN